jgi:dihydrofolate reductase
VRVKFTFYSENTFYYLSASGIGLEILAMPQVIYHVASSLDGFIADKDGKVDWLNEFNNSPDQEAMEDLQALMSSFDAILLGGATYDFVLDYGHWMSPATPTWVFTSRELKVIDPCIQLTQENPKSVCQELEKRNLKRIWLMGGWPISGLFSDLGINQ